jgi:ATP-dependent Clp protease ATP-binding subunit ClpX
MKLFSMDNVKLTFDEDALIEVARMAAQRKTGARGLRSILESAMLDVMYDIPNQRNITEVVIHRKTITNGEKPTLVFQEEKEAS